MDRDSRIVKLTGTIGRYTGQVLLIDAARLLRRTRERRRIEPTELAMPDILLTYAEEDRETARRVASLLEAQGWSVRWDRGTPAGQAAAVTTDESMPDMRCMVALWSRHSVNSDEVAAEAEQGRARKLLVPVLLEKVTPPLGLRSIQAADLSGWGGEASAPGARQLVADISALLGQPLPSGRVIMPPAKVAPRLHPAWLIMAALGLLLAAGLGAITLWRSAPPNTSLHPAASLFRYAATSVASNAVQLAMPLAPGSSPALRD